MARQVAAAVENSFKLGLITEATGLNFPESACTETYDCIFNLNGSFERRLGLDFEGSYTTKTINRTDVAVNTYLWKNVSGDGNTTLFVVQIGGTIYFYKTNQTGVSNGAVSSTLSLSTYLAAGAPSPNTIECQFTSGSKYMVVTHPYCDPFYVSYNTSTDTATGTVITISIRDFEGLAETGRVDSRPSTLSTTHQYNLANQGWPPDLTTTSATSFTIGTGSKAFTVPASLPFLVGDPVDIYSASGTGNNMQGLITAYSGTTLTVNVTTTAGAGTKTDWIICRVYAVAADHNTTITPPGVVGTSVNWLRIWNTNLSNYPSSADVPWLFKNSAGDFDTGTLQFRVPGNTPAPKGHFILTLSNQDRSSVSGISGISAVTTSYFRPSTAAFFASRIFYAGINAVGYNSKIYFSQLIINDNQYGLCYQAADPTSEDVHDLLPNDGGVISIPEAGTIIKLVAISGALVVFSNNGTWIITGSTGLGFTATDYSIQKISTINAISASPFVDVSGYPAWWNHEGIYILTPNTQALSQPNIQSLTIKTIKSFYDTIPSASKYTAKGFFHPISGVVQWLYRSTAAATPTDTYTYDRALNFNINTGAFYPWIIPSSAVTVNGIVVLDGAAGTTTQYDVNDDTANLVIDDTSNQVISFSFSVSAAGAQPVFKYLTSYTSGGSYAVTFSEARNTSYVDWYTYDSAGINYTSYLISGYKLRGQGLTKFQPIWIVLYSDLTEATRYQIQSIWDYANTDTNTNRWSTEQTVTHSDLITM